MKGKYKAAIIGCGGIGGFLDSPKDKMVVTHAHAYAKMKDFKLTCCCDLDPKKINDFKSRWGRQIRGYRDCEEMLKKETIDIISICSDTASHCGLLKKAFEKNGIRIVICEKPLVETINEFEIIRDTIKRHPEKRLVINYSRRYDPGFKIVEDIISRKKLGKPMKFSAFFTKGLYHNGSHMFELLERLFGGLKGMTVLEKEAEADDYYGVFFLEYNLCSGMMFNLKGSSYSDFELDIFTEKGKIQIAQSGHAISIFKRKKSLYRGYYELELQRKLDDTLKFSTLNLMQYVHRLLESGRKDKLSRLHLELSEDLLKVRRSLVSGEQKIKLWENLP